MDHSFTRAASAAYHLPSRLRWLKIRMMSGPAVRSRATRFGTVRQSLPMIAANDPAAQEAGAV